MPRILFIAALAFAFCSCRHPGQNSNGYIEGEYVYVSSPVAGAVQSLHVARGSTVKAGDELFTLESGLETARLAGAKERLDQASAGYEDAKKGKRPTEIHSIEFDLKQAHAALVFSELEFARQQKLFQSKSVSEQDLDRARALRDQDQNHVNRLASDLETAQLGSREDQIKMAEANMRAQQAAYDDAKWNLDQKRQVAPQDGLVFDTLYREGEWVQAGKPIVVLLPPQNIKLRTFVDEPHLGEIHVGDPVHIGIDGSAPVTGKVSFISPEAEYTPPVIYSRENRDKLMFLVEAEFEPEVAKLLHPGQPVDVEFGP